jgi:response regulator RpfG family c-di-GMP phosphodiesterase
MSGEEDELLFAEETETPLATGIGVQDAWKILLVDDESEIHGITKLVLGELSIMDKRLEFLSAYSGEEAIGAMSAHPDVAVILLDVVMEDDHAGLRVAKHIREVLLNRFVRIVLRTGQPGQAPESRVIVDYDINDYKEKGELTSQKLFTLMYSALRSYRDILALETHRRGLEKLVDASSEIFREQRRLAKFAAMVLRQVKDLLPHGDTARGFVAARRNGEMSLLWGGTGFENVGVGSWPEDIRALLDESSARRENLFLADRLVMCAPSHGGVDNFVYLEYSEKPEPLRQKLLEAMGANIKIAFDNVYLNRDMEDTQREIVYMLGEAVETRSKETGNHVKRVAELSKLMALKCGVDEEEAEIIKMASPMHDLGKVGIPDAILHKPGKLTPEEMEIMKTHAIIGYEVLRKSSRKALQTAAVIAHEHHEKWDGTGYPRGLKGPEISLEGRIAAVADVFDALTHRRCYKQAWKIDDVLEFFDRETGRHFDPNLVEILLRNLDRFQAIMHEYAD